MVLSHGNRYQSRGKEQTMSRWINADAMIRTLGVSDEDINFREILDSAPSIDIVRCQDCKYWVYHFNGCSRNPCTEPWYATDFCNYGEREGEPTTQTETQNSNKNSNVISVYDGVSEAVRCAMCSNQNKSDRGCDGVCSYDEKLYERIMKAIAESIADTPQTEREGE